MLKKIQPTNTQLVELDMDLNVAIDNVTYALNRHILDDKAVDKLRNARALIQDVQAAVQREMRNPHV